MEELGYSHNGWLVLASLCVAFLAGFTGLCLTHGLREKPPGHRKLLIAMAAIALGGGIWSMHFVAMLGLQLPILFYYDATITLISAMVAILVVGAALLILHFYPRTRRTMTLAGVLVATGILAMHYIGMSGLEMCRTIYSPGGVLVAIVTSILLSVGAFRIAYGRRERRNILLGTLCFGLTVFSVHFVAIYFTTFQPIAIVSQIGPLIGNEVLAIGVVVSSFVICAAFLLTGITFLSGRGDMAGWAPAAPALLSGGAVPGPAIDPPPDPAPQADAILHVPYEHAGRTYFIESGAIAVIRAEGHYTHLYTREGQLFCIWSITEAEKRFRGRNFVRCHRSFLINPDHVSSFERLKDTGLCHFDSVALMRKVPVSRSHMRRVRAALGL